MWNEYVEICGVSEREIHENLEAELHEFAAARGTPIHYYIVHSNVSSIFLYLTEILYTFKKE